MKEKETYEKWNLRMVARHLDGEMTPRKVKDAAT